jgi:electron transfer flavoprotein beta subunit
MNIAVPIKLVPDLVEEMEIDESGTGIDRTFLRLMLNELDEHAIEQAILLKENVGGQVTVIAPDMDGADDALFSSAAKGADRLVKFVGDYGSSLNNHGLARMFLPFLKGLQPDLVLTGVQAHDNLDGAIGPLLAQYLGMPYVGYVAGVSVVKGECTVRKEYPGGLIAEMQVSLPAVLGIQAAEEPPRYVAISRVRQAQKSATIEEQEAGAIDTGGGVPVARMFLPEVGERATMIEGDEQEIASEFVKILKDKALL